MVLIAKREKYIHVTTIDDLMGQSVGVYSGSSYGEEFDSSVWMNKDSACTNEALLRKLDLGHERVAKHWCEKLKLAHRFKTLGYIVTTNPTYVAFSRARSTGQDWATEFSQVLVQMEKEGYMQTLKIKYQF